ncbi:hypothetical protein EMIT0P176_90158 [Pseudomonas sp. IT-P176]
MRGSGLEISYGVRPQAGMLSDKLGYSVFGADLERNACHRFIFWKSRLQSDAWGTQRGMPASNMTVV